MYDPYNYPFVQKDNTMYLSTISIYLYNEKLKMILLQDLIILDSHLFKKKIFKGLLLKHLYPKNKQEPISHCLLM